MRVKFGDRLKQLRTEHGLTMEALVNAIRDKYPGTSINKSQVSRYESNLVKPKQFDTIETLAEFFDVHVNYMMGRSNNRHGDSNSYKRVPILGTIAAGIPILAQEDLQGYEYVPQSNPVDFCLIVKGDSMINARIFNGDIVYIRQQPDVENGEIAVVMLDDEEATLKRVYKFSGNVILKAENPVYKETLISKTKIKSLKILGKALYFKSEVR